MLRFEQQQGKKRVGAYLVDARRWRTAGRRRGRWRRPTPSRRRQERDLGRYTERLEVWKGERNREMREVLLPTATAGAALVASGDDRAARWSHPSDFFFT